MHLSSSTLRKLHESILSLYLCLQPMRPYIGQDMLYRSKPPTSTFRPREGSPRRSDTAPFIRLSSFNISLSFHVHCQTFVVVGILPCCNFYRFTVFLARRQADLNSNINNSNTNIIRRAVINPHSTIAQISYCTDV